MKICIAQTAGFCFGVRRAVDMALDATSGSRHGILTLGPVIHNAQTVEMLEERGARIIDSPEQITPGATVLVRAHGIAPQTEEQLRERTGHVLDGTCPKVKTVHRVIEKYCAEGFDIIITGDAGHAEVTALEGYAGERGHLIHSVEDVARLPDSARVCLVSQTTFDRLTFDAIARAIRDRYPRSEVVIKKTICAATTRRQEETLSLARQVDVMIVVGGRNSANTQRLAEIARQNCARVMHVESEQEIEPTLLQGCTTIGITAGASTPNWMIQKVADSIAYLDRRSRNTIFTRLRTLVETLTALNVFVAGGAAIMYGVSSHLQGLPATRSGAVIAYLYFFSMYLWNSLASIESTRHHGIGRYRIYQKHKKGLYAVSMAATAAMFLLARQRSLPVFLILLFATLAGTAYHLTIVPRRMRSLMRYRNLKDIPTSRDLFVSLAWATVLTFLPWRSSAVQPLPALFCFGWIGILAYLRSVIFDLRDIEGDRIMGRETLVTIVGEKRIRAALLAVLPLALTGLLVYPAILLLTQQGIPGRGYAFIIQIPVLVYIFLFLKYNNRIGLAKTTVFTLLADGQFYLSGALALGMWTISRLL